MGVTVTDDMMFEGDGIERTVIQVTPDTLTSSSILFYVNQGVNIRLTNMTLKGPTALHSSEAADGSNANTCFAIFHEGGGGEIHIDCCRMTQFNQCIKTDTNLTQAAWTASTVYGTVGTRRTNGGKVYRVTEAGTSASAGGPTGTGADITDGTVHWAFVGPYSGCKISISGGLIQGRSLGVLMLEGADADAVEFHAIGAEFSHDSNAFTGQHHNLYISRGVALFLHACIFNKAVSYAVHYYGSSGLVPRGARVSNCHFDKNVVRSIITNPLIDTVIDACTFRGGDRTSSHITVAGPFLVSNCQFINTSTSAESYCIIDDQGVAAEGSVIGCVFNEGGHNGYVYQIRRMETDTSKPWIIAGCRFFNALSRGFIFGMSSGGRVEFHDCSFFTAVAANLMTVQAGYFVLIGNRFHGPKRPYFGNTNGALTLVVESNDFDVGSNCFSITRSNSNSIKVYGHGNKFGANNPFVVSGATSDIEGHLELEHRWGSYTHSSGLLTIYGGNAVLIDQGSTPAYDDITISNASAVRHADVLFGTTLLLAAKQSFTLNHNTGTGQSKILLKGASNRTISANESILLRHSPALAAWIEVSG